MPLPKPSTLLALSLIASTAYFQARAATRFVAERWLVEEAETKPVSALAGVVPRWPTADAIIARNPFDSITGPLLGKRIGNDNPLAAPVCTDAQLLIVSESADRSSSLATLRGGDDAPAVVRRIGDRFEQRQVELIGYNPARRTPTVWLSREADGTLCQAPLFQAEHGALSASAAPKATTPWKVRKLSDTQFELDRADFEDILAKQSALLNATRIVPESRDGKVLGIRVFGVRPGGVLSSLGLQNGDRLDSINGFSLSDPEQALAAYATLRRSTSFDLRLERRGQPLTISVDVR